MCFVYHRNIFEVLLRRLGSMPVMLVIGPRQCGKTTMVKMVAQKKNMYYLSFDDITTLASVQFDPVGFLKERKKPLIIDEAQRAPELFLPIKSEIDSDRKPGIYILTGSANPLLVPHLGDALTGRMGICNLWPLSQGELLGIKETFIDRVFDKKSWSSEYPLLSKKELLQKIALGGFPTLHTLNSEQERREWCNDYLFNALQKDINELSKIERFSQIPALFNGIANRVGSTLNIEELSRIAHTSPATVRRYMQLLESLFLLYRVSAWSKNRDKKLVKSPKIYFSDTALLMHILGINEERLFNLPNLFGHVAENFVIMEIVKQITWSDQAPYLYHFRQENGAEVDLVLETFSGKLVGIEIKISEVVRENDLKGLLALKELSKETFYQGIIFYMGDKVVPFGNNCYAIPISALWAK